MVDHVWEAPDPRPAESPETQGIGAIETDALNLWYGTFQALFDVTLRIKQGIITSLIGPSGCGKSTLLRTVNRINERLGYVRTTGQVRVLGQDVLGPEVELAQLRKQVGMVFQRPNPLPLSVRQNVLFASDIHNRGLDLRRVRPETPDGLASDLHAVLAPENGGLEAVCAFVVQAVMPGGAVTRIGSNPRRGAGACGHRSPCR